MTLALALRLTAATDYADAIAQLAQIFVSPRTGDLVVCARLGHESSARARAEPLRKRIRGVVADVRM